ncbi:hypothetical protein [Pseudomonas segetis]|uniref:Peptidase n=1 Tax=Pseudomonas segetis TaxID=298908 RepID=A0A239C762_9PSED|nr:hypothetical protein [Pseudomonas segetis]SNS15950.1 hypothetical protein SAMN05216255_1544 [Pseudomonas segetis]
MTDETTNAGAQDTTAAPAEVAQSDAPPSTPESTTTLTQPAPGEEVAEGDKGGEQADKPTGPPDEYADFTVGEGAEIDADVLNDFKGIAKELGLTQEGAQKLIDLQSAMAAKQEQALSESREGLRKQWSEAVRNDPEFGGEKYDENVAIAAKTMQAFGDDTLRTLLNDSGLGNHPALVKFCHRIGKAISEDRLVMPGTQAAPAEMTIVDAFK